MVETNRRGRVIIAVRFGVRFCFDVTLLEAAAAMYSAYFFVLDLHSAGHTVWAAIDENCIVI